jgi:hypothetical protein
VAKQDQRRCADGRGRQPQHSGNDACLPTQPEGSFDDMTLSRCMTLSHCASDPLNRLDHQDLQRSDRVPLGFLQVDTAGGRLPLVPARPGLCDVPAGRLLHLVALAASRARIAAARPAALMVGDRVFEI